jgi:hypothetical protein
MGYTNPLVAKMVGQTLDSVLEGQDFGETNPVDDLDDKDALKHSRNLMML